MSESTHLGHALGHFFSNVENGVFADFGSAIAGLTATQAAAVPGERMNSVWAVVNHVWFWNEMPLRKLRGEETAPEALGAPSWGGWVPAGDPADEAAWQQAQARALAANAAFAAAVAALSPEQLAANMGDWGPTHALVQAMVVHNAYHTAEIITVRHAQGLWVNHQFI